MSSSVPAPSPEPPSSARRQKLLRLVRPSIMDARFTCDLWLEDREDGTFKLQLGGYCLSEVAGVTFDLPSLNQVLDRLRHRSSRRRARGSCG